MALDVGRANERTALAWQRTALALMAGAAILARLTFDDVGVAALTPLAIALLLSLWVFLESRRRYADHAGIRERSGPRSGRAVTALTVATALVALTELAVLLTQ